MRSGKRPKTVGEYIRSQASPQRTMLAELKTLVEAAAPEAVPRISYGMPAYFLNRVLVYFAAFKHHIGFYPMTSAVRKFQKDLKTFKHAVGSVQFPLTRPLPKRLISRMLKFRMAELRKKEIGGG